MDRSKKGLSGAGEWRQFQKFMPDFRGKRVLDLGCGYGWHCRYAAENGAASVLGTDISQKMLRRAEEMSVGTASGIVARPWKIWNSRMNPFDIVLSSLAFHYVRGFFSVC